MRDPGAYLLGALCVVCLMALTYMLLTWPGRSEERDWQERRSAARDEARKKVSHKW